VPGVEIPILNFINVVRGRFGVAVRFRTAKSHRRWRRVCEWRPLFDTISPRNVINYDNNGVISHLTSQRFIVCLKDLNRANTASVMIQSNEGNSCEGAELPELFLYIFSVLYELNVSKVCRLL
jgi:hypothetical protein